MSLEVPEAELRKLREGFARLASGDNILDAMDRTTQELVKAQFGTGVGRYGRWEPANTGGPALLSRRLPQGFDIRIARGELRHTSKPKRARAAQVRATSSASRTRTFERVHKTFERAKPFSDRTPPRPSDVGVPAWWESALDTAAVVEVQRWYDGLK